MLKKPIQFVREIRGELKKVSWSSRSELIHTTTLVLIGLTIFTAFIAVSDMGFSKFLQMLVK
jgi:preprotein translocase subunit SecE